MVLTSTSFSSFSENFWNKNIIYFFHQIDELKRVLKKKRLRALKIRTGVGIGAFEKVFSPVSDEDLEKHDLLRILENIKSGVYIPTEELLKVAVLFDDFTDFGADNDKIVRRICKYMGIRYFDFFVFSIPFVVFFKLLMF